MTIFRGITCSVISILLLSLTAWAGEPMVIADFSSGVNADGLPAGWQLKEKSGKAEFAVVKEGGRHALKMKSRKTSFSLQKEVKVDLKQYPVLTWDWKVSELPIGGDFRKSSTDDQAAQLFLAFSKWQAIVYVWDSTVPEGTIADAASPPFMTIKAVVVRSGPAQSGKWLTESRNVYEDYKKIFGKEPPPVSGFRIQINSQHTGSSAESYFANVVFQKN